MLTVSMRGRDPIRTAVVVLVLGGIGCASKAARQPDAATPAAEQPPTTDVKAQEDPDQYARDLDRFETELRGAGVLVAADESEGQLEQESTQTTASQRDRCTRICDLATAICELEDRVCGLASVHAGDQRYGRVCTRAKDDCALATSACRECTGG